jgi:hypothetical protein
MLGMQMFRNSEGSTMTSSPGLWLSISGLSYELFLRNGEVLRAFPRTTD